MQHQRRFVADPPRRVLALGSPGSGRARLADRVATKFSLPILSLDAEKKAFAGDPSAWRKRVADLSGSPNWVMIGNDPESRISPVRSADWLVFLDMPMTMCLMRILRAATGARDLAPDIEAGLWRAMREAWEFPTDIAPHIVQVIERERRNRTIFILHSNRDVARFVANLPDADGSASNPGRKSAPPS